MPSCQSSLCSISCGRVLLVAVAGGHHEAVAAPPHGTDKFQPHIINAAHQIVTKGEESEPDNDHRTLVQYLVRDIPIQYTSIPENRYLSLPNNDLGRPGRSAVRVPLERGITLVLGECPPVEGWITECLFKEFTSVGCR